MKKIYQKIFIGLFIVPQLLFCLFSSHLNAASKENRELIDFESVLQTGLRDKPEQFKKFYDDHIPFRSYLINTWNTGIFKVFHEATDDRIVVGKNDGSLASTWLFYTLDTEESPVKQAQGLFQFSDEKMDQMYQNMLKNQKDMLKENRQLFYMYCPNKETIYKDMLPDYVKIIDNQTRTQKFSSYLNSQGFTDFVFPVEDLSETRKNIQNYKKQDTHWNEYGAYVGYCSLIHQLYHGEYDDFANDAQFSSTENVPIEEDLNNMSGVKNVFLDTAINWSFHDDLKVEETTEKVNTNVQTDTVCKDAPIDKTLLVIGDSYRTSMIYYLERTFTRCIFMHRDEYEESIIDKVNPDIIVMESVERYSDANSLKVLRSK